MWLCRTISSDSQGQGDKAGSMAMPGMLVFVCIRFFFFCDGISTKAFFPLEDP